MILEIAFFELKPGLEPIELEKMLRSSRSILLRIPEVLSVRSGRNLDTSSSWPFFYSIECETKDKLVIVHDDPLYLKFIEKVIKPNIQGKSLVQTYELDPSKDLKYS